MTGRERDDRPGAEHEQTVGSSAWGNGMTASEAEFAADLSAVQADDALLDALGGSDPAIADSLGDQELNALLVAWRRDIDSEPLAELVDVDTAVRTVGAATLARRNSGRGRRRMLVPVAAAAAVLAIAFTGTGLAARDAQPGDTLWGLTKVLYADHARSVEAAAAAKLDLEKANLALAGGNLDLARKALADAQAALSQVTDAENRDQLLQQHRQLSAQLDDPTAPAPPPGQLPSQQPSNPTTSPSNQASGAPTTLPGSGGSTSLPVTSSTPSPTPPPPVTPTTTPPPPVTTTTPATGNGPGGSGTPRSETGAGGQGQQGQAVAPSTP
ncbi:anti-sigma-D factor RsdA [Amycolatopsis sp. NPDC059021]|uniref:anti-sigma-D factor RsdA n=1 Tax=Amycolatopsis sp. NPDC059021 TaxID=3346704 RepID=UPI003671AEA9